jgi:hypothetical protein
MGATNFPNGITAAGGITGPAGETVITTPSAVARIAGGEGIVTGATLDVVTGLATIVGFAVVLAEDPGATAGDVFTVSAVKHATPGTLTVSIWQDDATAATEDTSISWVAVGT